MTRKIYVASSWSNKAQPSIVVALRAAGHDVYDFRHPDDGEDGFAWAKIDPEYRKWTQQEFIHHLQTSPIAAHGFKRDRDALDWCDTFVLLLPCGRSAHLEAGYACGQGKRVIIMLSDEEPLFDLMYLFATGGFVSNVADLCVALAFDDGNRSTIIGNDRICDLASSALAFSNNDPVRAVEILRGWTSIAFDTVLRTAE
jgi:nucleoside 2-deoxyribosyltransferase